MQKKDASVGDITAVASNSAGIYSLAGGLAIGGKNAVGISISWNDLNNDTRTLISGSEISARNFTDRAMNESSILTIAIGAGVSSGNGIGGTVAVAISNGNTAALISGSTINLTGTMLAEAQSVAGLGAGSYYDDILAEMKESEKDENGNPPKSGYLNGDFDLGADAKYDEDGNKIDEKITKGEYDALAAKETLTETEKEQKKKYEQSQANLGLAAQSPKIVTAALAVAGGKGTAAGANVAVNLLTDTTVTAVENSSITSVGNSTYGATTEGGIFALGIGVAGSTGGFTLSGNLGVNIIGGSTAVEFKDNTELKSNAAFIAQARNASGIIGIGVNVAGGSGTAIGVSAGYNQIAHATKVDIFIPQAANKRTFLRS